MSVFFHIRRRASRAAPVICALLICALFAAPAIKNSAEPLLSRGIAAVPAGASSVSEKDGLRGVTIVVKYDDAECVEYALKALEDAVSFFPEGVFEDLELTVELCGRLRFSFGTAAGLTFPDGKRVLLDISEKSPSLTATAVHELCHVIDAELDRLAENDPSHWNEDDWNGLNPPDFDYSMTYTADCGQEHTLEDDPNAAYFINAYAKTSPYEDRAELMEALALMGIDGIKSPRLRDKMNYYYEAVRYYLAPKGY